jgi:hypothetical protein
MSVANTGGYKMADLHKLIIFFTFFTSIGLIFLALAFYFERYMSNYSYKKHDKNKNKLNKLIILELNEQQVKKAKIDDLKGVI